MNVLLEEKNVLIAVASILLEKKLLLVKVLAVHLVDNSVMTVTG
jgi:hypothetical protein